MDRALSDLLQSASKISMPVSTTQFLDNVRFIITDNPLSCQAKIDSVIAGAPHMRQALESSPTEINDRIELHRLPPDSVYLGHRPGRQHLFHSLFLITRTHDIPGLSRPPSRALTNVISPAL